MTSLAFALPVSEVRQPGLFRDVEDFVHARTPHVGVHQQHAKPGLRHGDRDIGRADALAFARAGAR